jgi:hypothetical protein
MSPLLILNKVGGISMTELRARNKLATSAPQVVEGYRNGATLRELAQIHSVSAGTIRNCLISNGVALRSRGRRRGSQEATDGFNS